jgi:predicted RNase H-like HicB family nuclease
MTVEFNVHIWKEGSQFVAHALPLDVASSGGSPQEAREALDEAVGLFLKTAAEQGTLDKVLEDAGYHFTGSEWRSPDWVASERHSLAVAA